MARYSGNSGSGASGANGTVTFRNGGGNGPFISSDVAQSTIGIFGSGQQKILSIPGTYSFVVPDGIFKLRAISVGAGGSGGSQTKTGGSGGTSSVGVFISATGGVGGGSAATGIGGTGGMGVGGDINYAGGKGGDSAADKSGAEGEAVQHLWVMVEKANPG